MRVDGTRGLDEDQRLGVREQRAGQREALPLAAGERPAALLDLAVQAVGERLEDVLAAGDREGAQDRGVVVAAATGPARRAASP